MRFLPNDTARWRVLFVVGVLITGCTAPIILGEEFEPTAPPFSPPDNEGSLAPAPSATSIEVEDAGPSHSSPSLDGAAPDSGEPEKDIGIHSVDAGD